MEEFISEIARSTMKNWRKNLRRDSRLHGDPDYDSEAGQKSKPAGIWVNQIPGATAKVARNKTRENRRTDLRRTGGGTILRASTDGQTAIALIKSMYFGADYHPEHWVHPFAGTAEEPESRWKRDIELMVAAGVNAVRMGEFVWGICEPEEGVFDFEWLRRVMDLMGLAGIQVVLSTPTVAPPIWLTRKYPGILPVDARGLVMGDGTRLTCCLNSDIYWDYSKKIIRAMAEALGNHSQLIAWQIHNNPGVHSIIPCFNQETQRDWHAWLKAKYETIDRLNEMMGLRFWGQMVHSWSQVPMPMVAPAPHNPALLMDWRRLPAIRLWLSSGCRRTCCGN